MAPITRLDHLSNALVTSEQLSRLHDGTSLYRTEDAQSIRFVQGELTQAAGVLLRLPQEVIANTIVILQRFWISFDDYEEDKVGCPIVKRHSRNALPLPDKVNFRCCLVPDREACFHSCLATISLQRLCLPHIHGLPFVVRQSAEIIRRYRSTSLLCYGRDLRNRAAKTVYV
jgi:hypothetical protein